MTLPLVSICIPTYNRSLFLKEAIASALATDYPNIEVVVSDNASTDDTCQVVQSFNDERIKYFKNETNIGAFGNFRKVLYEYAKGEYAIYLADDDLFIDRIYLPNAVNLIVNNSEIVLVLSNWRYIKEGKYRDIIFSFDPVCSGKKLVAGYFPKKLYDPFPYHLMFYTALFNRNLAIDINAMSSDCLDIDVLFMLKMAACGKVGFLDSISVAQRYTGNNFSSVAPYEKRFESMFVIGSELKEHLEKIGMSSSLIKDIKMRIAKKESNHILGRLLCEVHSNRSKAKLFSMLLEFATKLYNENALLLLMFLKPKVIVQLILVNFNSYSFLRKKFGISYRLSSSNKYQ